MRIDCALDTKSRLAGFFLCLMLLNACTEAPATKTSFNLQQAIIAEENALFSKALPLYRKAAAEGDIEAVAAVLRLTPKGTSIAELNRWLHSLPLTASQRLPFLAKLGLWQQLTASEATHVQQYWQQQFLVNSKDATIGAVQRDPAAADRCALKIQPVLSTEQSAIQWQQLTRQWQLDQQMSSLAICFSQPVFIDALALGCSEQPAERIQCDSKALKTVVKQTGATQLLVISGMGGASYNNGWLQLPENASLPLLRHELSHAFGFIDEYPLAPSIAHSECTAGRITPNILFAKEDLPAYLERWQLTSADVVLTAVDSCQHAAQQAYRVVRTDSHLQHYELAMPDLYLKLMHKQLQQPELLMPVAYYFAYLARQEQDWQAWQQWMQLAAGSGYPPALEALAEARLNGRSHSAR